MFKESNVSFCGPFFINERHITGTVAELAWWARSAFDYLAMGNYPYATGYILNDGDGGVTLPPWPLRVACSFMADPELQVLNLPLQPIVTFVQLVMFQFICQAWIRTSWFASLPKDIDLLSPCDLLP